MKRRRFADLAIGGRILTGFGLAAALLLFVLGYGLASLARVSEGERDLVRILDTRRAARMLDVDVLNIIVTLSEFVDTRDTTLLAELAERREDADAQRGVIRRSTRHAATLAALDEYESLLPRRRALAQQLVAAVLAAPAGARVAPRLAEILDERRRLDRDARALLREMLDQQEALAAGRQALHREESLRIRRNMFIAGGFAVAMMLLLTIAVTRSITAPIERLHQMTDQIGRGDFSARSDVTSLDEIGDFARALNVMAASVAQLDRAKDEFLGLASHQLRTPATSVKNFIGLLREGYAGDLTEEQKSYVDYAWEGNEQQLATIDAMLRVAHADAGRLVLRRQPTDFGSLVSRIVDQQRPQIAERGHSCLVDLPPEPVNVMVDAEYLAMAIENLVSNASKYMHPGGTITVTVRESHEAATLAVRDTGIGIAEEDRYRLFSKFSRIENPLSVEVGGSGIGLYLTKHIIELHQGTIQMASRPGEGTAFTVTLPRTWIPPMAKVLVIEDDLRLKITYDVLLTKEGHVVERAVNGEEALAKLATFQPDLILLDLMMPKMTGIEFLEAARLPERFPNVKVIVFSNMSMPEKIKRAYELGASNYMVKASTSPKQLAALVRQTLAAS